MPKGITSGRSNRIFAQKNGCSGRQRVGQTLTLASRRPVRLHTFANARLVAESAEAQLALVASACLGAKGSFHIVLAGGSTPEMLYGLLREIATDWWDWHIYFGDERCLPPGYPGRNDTMIMKQQLIVMNQGKKRSPKLATADRFLFGILAIFIGGSRLNKIAVVIKPTTLLAFHQSLVKGNLKGVSGRNSLAPPRCFA